MGVAALCSDARVAARRDSAHDPLTGTGTGGTGGSRLTPTPGLGPPSRVTAHITHPSLPTVDERENFAIIVLPPLATPKEKRALGSDGLSVTQSTSGYVEIVVMTVMSERVCKYVDPGRRDI